MNSIKNAIVTITLLAVGYGAYLVLHDPPPADFDQLADGAAEVDEEGNPMGSSNLNVEIESGSTDSQASESPSSFNPPAGHLGATPLEAPEPPDTLAYPSNQNPAASLAPGPQHGAPADYAVNQHLMSPEHGPHTDGSGAAPAQADSVAPPIEPPTEVPSGASASAAPSSEGSGPFENAWQQVQQHLESSNLVEALALLSTWYGDPTLSQEQNERCIGKLDQLAGTVIYSRQHVLEPEYQVQTGETLADIAARYEVPEVLLANINGISPPYALLPGDVLKVVRGPFHGEVSVQNRELTLFVDRFYAGRFPIQIGRDLPTQEALYEVAEKSDGRSYFDRRLGREILKGEADNRYGDHWLGLRGDQITAGHSVGIHGRPQDLQTSDEVGCISLDSRQAGDVYSILSVGSRIRVRR